MSLLDYSAWILALLAPTLIQPAYASCQLKEKEIIGEWQAAGEDGFFEEFELANNHRFNSWLHQRPEFMNATWRLNDCTLIILDKAQSRLVYQVKLIDSQLLLIERTNGVDYPTRYRKIKH